MTLAGLSAFPITPMTEGGRVEAEAYGALVARAAAAGVDAIGALGSTGTYAYLAAPERDRAIAIAVEAAGAVPVIAGVGALRTDEAVARARAAARAGAAALLLAPMRYTPLTEDELFAHYRAVCEATDLPLVLYSNPGTTGVRFSDPLLARIAALPGVAGVKLPLPEGGAPDEIAAEIAARRAILPAGVVLGYSGDWGCSALRAGGAEAWFSVVAGILPAETLALDRAATAGDAAELARLEARFAALWDVFREASSLRVVHAMAAILGLASGLPPRPILPLPRALMGRVEAALAGICAR